MEQEPGREAGLLPRGPGAPSPLVPGLSGRMARALPMHHLPPSGPRPSQPGDSPPYTVTSTHAQPCQRHPSEPA